MATKIPIHAVALLAAACCLASCGKEPASPDSVAEAEPTTGDTYHVRGRITELPDESSPFSALRIHHEPIPDFKDREGTVRSYDDGSTGMRAMIMEFPLGPGESLDGFGVGDAVAFDLTVTWGSPPYFVTNLVKLDAGTRLLIDVPPADDEPVEQTGD